MSGKHENMNRADEQQGLSVEQSINLALQHHAAGRFPEAESIYQRILRANPDQPDALHLLGVIAHQAGQDNAAVDLISRALSIKPDVAEAHNNLGIALRKLGRPEDAVASFHKTLALKPDFAEAHNNLGNALRELGKLEDAVASYNRTLVLKPDYAEAHNNLGNGLRELGRLEDAVASFLKAVALKPGYAEAHNNLGNAYHSLGRLEEALKSCRRALEANPDLVDARHLISALTGEKVRSSPKNYVQNLFDGYADRFDEHLTKTLNYTIPESLIEGVISVAGDEARFQNAVDMGCGTGLSGIQFRRAAVHLTGIDISKKMVKKARDKGIYDRLIIGDISQTLDGSDTPFDLFICADTFIYVGDLHAIFRSVKNRAAQNALFAFSVEQTDVDDCVLDVTGRFSHSVKYIKSLADEFGFTKKLEKEVVLRLGQEMKDVVGKIFIFQCAGR